MIGSTFEGPFGSLRGLADHRGERSTTATSRRRSAAPATAFATVVLIVVLAVLAAPVSASGEPSDAGASGATGATAPMVAAPPAGALPGIDVSHHQGAIDWSQVAGAGTRFAFAKATEGRSYVDPTYATNKAGAALSGVVFGAYHFARPDDTANDANPATWSRSSTSNGPAACRRRR
jgi:GH25 family lysozyme M1 (1,4-beta-N-acetylmuramidase)